MVGLLNAAVFATVGGGVLAGGLHAVSGPDHLAALLPRIMGQKWHNSMRIGATWGLGHGFSATVIGLAVSKFCEALGNFFAQFLLLPPTLVLVRVGWHIMDIFFFAVALCIRTHEKKLNR